MCRPSRGGSRGGRSSIPGPSLDGLGASRRSLARSTWPRTTGCRVRRVHQPEPRRRVPRAERREPRRARRVLEVLANPSCRAATPRARVPRRRGPTAAPTPAGEACEATAPAHPSPASRTSANEVWTRASEPGVARSSGRAGAWSRAADRPRVAAIAARRREPRRRAVSRTPVQKARSSAPGRYGAIGAAVQIHRRDAGIRSAPRCTQAASPRDAEIFVDAAAGRAFSWRGAPHGSLSSRQCHVRARNCGLSQGAAAHSAE